MGSHLNSTPSWPDNFGHVAEPIFSLRFIMAHIGTDNIFLSGRRGDDLVRHSAQCLAHTGSPTHVYFTSLLDFHSGTLSHSNDLVGFLSEFYSLSVPMLSSLRQWIFLELSLSLIHLCIFQRDCP